MTAPNVRVDRWLWAARCFKSRTQATDACRAGHVSVNGATADAARPVRPGDQVAVLTPGGPRQLEVVALAERRGSATVAAALFVDHTPPPPPRPPPGQDGRRDHGAGRPTKRDRRSLHRVWDQGW